MVLVGRDGLQNVEPGGPPAFIQVIFGQPRNATMFVVDVDITKDAARD